MHHPATLSLHRPLLERWVLGLAESLSVAWRQHRARRHRERCIDAMADLGPAVLRDIGAPEDVLNQAASRRRADAGRLEELRIVANYRGLDSRFW